MASFRIHEDQENRRPDIPQKDIVKLPLQQKRTVLGALDNKPSQIITKTKQITQKAFGELKIRDAEVGKKGMQVLVSVPVAQFEAFKVYEDEKENKKEEGKVCQDENVLAIVKACPMSVEKNGTGTGSRQATCRQEREILFEMPEYRESIQKYLREAETRNRPKPGYMKKQPDITQAMRTILVDWLVEVGEEYRLQTETLHLAVAYIDRFLSYMSVVRAKLQLVGTAAMFIASKYEEIYPPDVGEFVYITDDTYSRRQVLRMEQLMLKVLAFDLSGPTSLTFLRGYMASAAASVGRSADDDERLPHLAAYVLELGLLEPAVLQHAPSVLAAAALLVARGALRLEPAWPEQLALLTGYSRSELRPCEQYLRSQHASASVLPHQAIQDKYKTSKYHHVSLVPPCDQEQDQEQD